MKKTYSILLVALLLFSCSKEEVRFDDLVEQVFFPRAVEFMADGKSKIRIDIRFVEGTEVSSIKAVAKVNRSFAVHEGSDKEELTLEPEVATNGRILTGFTIVSTTRPGEFQIELEVNQYRRFYNLESIASPPSALSLSKSSNSVQAGYLGEVTIEGFITNAEGAKASQGVKAEVSDVLENGDPANGIFRALQLTSNGESKISLVYSPGPVSMD
ncbi:MAG: hypothetical protein HRT65_04780 [Flavobacteriaceae bacterium]|nr:hypothetical protein [Flavobacteriaceae bacterium]